MRNRCILGLLMVFGISLVSVVAFANSFTGEPAKRQIELKLSRKLLFRRRKMQHPMRRRQ